MALVALLVKIGMSWFKKIRLALYVLGRLFVLRVVSVISGPIQTRTFCTHTIVYATEQSRGVLTQYNSPSKPSNFVFIASANEPDRFPQTNTCSPLHRSYFSSNHHPSPNIVGAGKRGPACAAPFLPPAPVTGPPPAVPLTDPLYGLGQIYGHPTGLLYGTRVAGLYCIPPSQVSRRLY